MKTFVTTLAFSALALSAFAGVSSGLKSGESVSQYHPNHFAGALAKSTNCFPCTYKMRPQTQVFVHGDNLENVAKIAKALDDAMGKYGDQEFKALVVLITDKKSESATQAAGLKIAKDHKLNRVHMATITPDHEAVNLYKINLDKSIKNTVIVYKNWKVASTMTNLKGDAAGLKSLMASVSQVTK